MSHLVSLHDATGCVMFSNSEFSLLRIGKSVGNSIDILNAIKQFTPIASHWSSRLMGPQFPNIIFLNKNGNHKSALDDAVISVLDNEAIMNSDSSLQEVVLTLKMFKGRDEHIAISPMFIVANLNASNNSIEIPAISESFKITFTGDNFTTEYTGSTGSPIVGAHFLNRYESVYVPFDDEQIARTMIQKIVDRSNLDGRMAPGYMVYPTFESHRPGSRLLDLRSMKTDDILRFFGHHKKSNTKIETISGCLRAVYKRYVKEVNTEVGQIGVLHIASGGKDKSPMDFPPIDWVLTHACLFESVHAEAIDTNAQNVFMKISDEPRDDFAELLYTIWEQSSNMPIRIAYFDPSRFKKIFGAVRNRDRLNQPVV